MGLSVIIITKNEEAVIRRCLDSIAWADEIIVFDSGSQDRTVEICRELGARVYQAPDWPGFGPQKNRALDLATGDWVFSLDADEWVTGELRAEIERAIATAGDRQAFMLPRRSSFCGRFLHHSGWSPDYVVRLFRRGAARFSDDLVHERLLVHGATGRLVAPLQHEAIRDLDEMLAKMNAYSTASAVAMGQSGKRGALASALVHGAWAFFRTYVLRGGLLDGREGFILAIANAEGSYYRYLKLMLTAEQATHEPRD